MPQPNSMMKKLVYFLAILLFLTSRYEVQAEKGLASWYGGNHQGRKTSSGESFNPKDFTCASWHYPFGTILRVSYLDKFVLVRVNDRGPARRLHRIIDLSEASFAALENTRKGLITVTVERIQ